MTPPRILPQKKDKLLFGGWGQDQLLQLAKDMSAPVV